MNTGRFRRENSPPMASLHFLSTTSMIPNLHPELRVVPTSVKIDMTRRISSCSPALANRRPMLLITAAAAAVFLSAMGANAVELGTEAETLENIPQTLSGECIPGDQLDCKKRSRIQKPKSRKAESCTIKCVGTCIRGGYGSPGEGPLNVRRPLVVFKQGFRTRHYCLLECSEICNLIGDGDDGP